MDSQKIIDQYWEIFLSHVCEFYPLEKDFIQTYAYELDWIAISKNKVIPWDIDFIDKYQDRLVWHEIALNDAISWTSDKIDKYKKRLDWHYLSRNRNLPVTEEFITKYAKKLSVIENNPLLTKELIQQFNLKVIPANKHNTQELEKIDLANIEELLQNWSYYHNQQLFYSNVVLPVIKDLGLPEIFKKKFDYSQRYFILDALQNDMHGLTPEYEIVSTDPFSTSGHNPFGLFREGRGFFPITGTLTLKYGSLREGPDRLYEVPRISSFSYYTILLVSEHVKAVLEKFKLPAHTFHPAKLIPKKIVTQTKFYILQLDHDTLTKDLDFDNVQFNYVIKGYKIKTEYGLVKNTIQSYEDYEKVSEEYLKDDTLNDAHLYPDTFRITTGYDVYSYSVHGKIIITEFLKNILEEKFPGQMSFQSAQLLNIRMNQELYDQKKTVTNEAITIGGNRVAHKESAVDRYYYDKMERLEKDDPPLPEELLQKDKFSEKEKELKVIFPATIKQMITKKKLKIKHYRLLKINDFYIENGYADTVPESYKSVVIAENGLGDSINLLLEKDSDFLLGETLYEFLHETGEVERFIE